MDTIISAIENHGQKFAEVDFTFLRLELDQEMYQRFLGTIPSLECVRMSCHFMRQLDELLDCLVGELNFPKDLFISQAPFTDGIYEFGEQQPLTRRLCNFLANNRSVEGFCLRFKERVPDFALLPFEIENIINILTQVLCDVTSIESIIHSNHSLRRLELQCFPFDTMAMFYGNEDER